MEPKQKLLQSKMFWIGVFYFAEGFPLGIFYEIFPVHFRLQGVDLRDIGFLSLLGLAWTLKFIWAPAIDYFRHHRRWMFFVDVCMALIMIIFAIHAEFGSWVWIAIACFTILSATNDIAIDGYTIELLKKNEMGLANGLRIGFYRVGMLATGIILMVSDWIGWSGAYLCAAIILATVGLSCLFAPKEKEYAIKQQPSFVMEAKNLFLRPQLFSMVLMFLLGALWLINNATKWSHSIPYFWWVALACASLSLLVSGLTALYFQSVNSKENSNTAIATQGPIFGALMEMLQRPYIIPVIIFILIFKLADTSMGFMVKPFWVDAGFSASQIGLVSVNIGLLLSIAGGLAGGWFTDRIGIFNALWILGLLQAFSNLGYVLAASVIPLAEQGQVIISQHKVIMYCASAFESFSGGLGTAAFLAFLMAIVDKRRSATEYALLSSVFALSRSISGWAGGFGAQFFGYAPYFFLTFLLAFPAYALLPWVKKMMTYAESQKDWHQE